MTDIDDDHGRVTDGPLLDFHDQLVEAINRQNAEVTPIDARRSRSPRTAYVLVAAAAVVIALIGVFAVTTNDGNSEVAADVTVSKTSEGVIVSLDQDVTVAEIEKALDAAGVDAKVTGMPTGPSRVNRFVGNISPGSATLIGGDGKTSTKAMFVPGSKVELFLGVPAEGRPYDAGTVAWDRGEALAGPSLEGKRYADVSAELERRARSNGATIDYRLLSNGRPTTPEPDDIVAGTTGVDAETVIVGLERG